MASEKKSIADDIKSRLEAAWGTDDQLDDKGKVVTAGKPGTLPRERYPAAVATELIGLATFCEKVIRALAGKVRALEAKLAEATGKAPSQQGVQANGAEQPAAMQTPDGRPGPDMVRVTFETGEPLSPEDQAKEEEADMQFDGKIDMSRYVSRAQVARMQAAKAAAAQAAAGQPEAPAAPSAATPAASAAPPAPTVPAAPRAQG